jgi:D-alanine-D-alanine ligase-like ATP-grasp enzyme
MVRYATHDPDFRDLATAAYRVMPNVALQARDIIREKTGKEYLLEVNPGGGTWMFSSPNAPSYRTHLGTDDLTVEFDAFRTCPRVLIERTRAETI